MYGITNRTLWCVCKGWNRVIKLEWWHIYLSSLLPPLRAVQWNDKRKIVLRMNWVTVSAQRHALRFLRNAVRWTLRTLRYISASKSHVTNRCISSFHCAFNISMHWGFMADSRRKAISELWRLLCECAANLCLKSCFLINSSSCSQNMIQAVV